MEGGREAQGLEAGGRETVAAFRVRFSYSARHRPWTYHLPLSPVSVKKTFLQNEMTASTLRKLPVEGPGCGKCCSLKIESLGD